MPFRLFSVRVVAATAVAAVAGLLGAFLLLGRVSAADELRSQRAEDASIARVLGAQLASGASRAQLDVYAPLLALDHQRATVVRGAERWSFGANLAAASKVTEVTVPIAGGHLAIASSIDAVPDPPFQLVLVMAAVLLLVLGVAVAANLANSRETRRRVDAAVVAAERVAGGDLATRVGAGGPEELARLGRAFDHMAARLEAVDRDQRELLADLAHEIATPINALAGFSTAVLDGTISRQRAEPVIAAQRVRLSKLLDQLSLLRGLDGPKAVQLERLDLAEVCSALAAEFAPLAATQGIELRTRVRSTACATDRRLLETVLQNLLTNALRYTPPGGSVEFLLYEEAGRPVVVVRDTGPGIAPEHRLRVFDRFYRTDHARDQTSGGSGLGLTIARQAAQSLGGSLELRSDPGAGSEFRLVLPRPGRSSERAETTAQRAAGTGPHAVNR